MINITHLSYLTVYCLICQIKIILNELIEKLIMNNNYKLVYHFTNLKEKYYQRSRIWKEENCEKHVLFLFVLISFIGYKVFNKSDSKRIF